MSEYIEREALKKDLISRGFYPAIVRHAIEDAPTADVVEVRHGEWGFDGLGWTCSECGEYALANKAKMQVHSRHCPHCGAKMDGERREG